ncbi:MAG: LLM class flavin-dependent oxidoreductase [Candidatus Lambdaproteobacteria bacterium]|nr:LLM class flavin-dependent oxidoreductase [Candidatus Lambdaproteobacteria bacterium]
MEFGFSHAKIDEIGLITHAENLGYTHCWVTDTQFIRSECFAVLALAAQQTRRIKLGTGVAVAGLRLAPVTANGIATINRIAPGRTFLGIGTGNTAMRMMGQRPMRVKAFGEYLRVVRGLLAGEEMEYTLAGTTHRIKFLMRDARFIALEPPIPMLVGGFGPKAQALAGEYGDGVVTSWPRGGDLAQVHANVRLGAARAGRTHERIHTTMLFNLVLLEPGEALTSDRVLQEAGHTIMSNVQYLADHLRETGKEPPDYLKPIWKEYLRFHLARPAATRHYELHESHSAYLRPDEARFCTPELIRALGLVGQPEELIEKLREFERQGVSQVLFTPPLERGYKVIEDFARKVIAKM